MDLGPRGGETHGEHDPRAHLPPLGAVSTTGPVRKFKRLSNVPTPGARGQPLPHHQPMKPTQETIDHLVKLEAEYHYTPEGDGVSRDEILGPCESPIGEPFADLILHFEDQKRYDDCARIVRAILDTYAPRRSVLDFDGGEA